MHVMLSPDSPPGGRERCAPGADAAHADEPSHTAAAAPSAAPPDGSRLRTAAALEVAVSSRGNNSGAFGQFIDEALGEERRVGGRIAAQAARGEWQGHGKMIDRDMFDRIGRHRPLACQRIGFASNVSDRRFRRLVVEQPLAEFTHRRRHGELGAMLATQAALALAGHTL